MNFCIRLSCCVNRVISGNPQFCCESVTDLLEESGQQSADISLFPRLALCPPSSDALLLNPAVCAQCEDALDQVRVASAKNESCIIIGLVKERLEKPDCKNGFLFDGFPRTIPQAEALVKAGIPIDDVVEIAVPDEVILERMSGRRVHVASGRTYHVKFNPPKVEGVDDVTGEPLIQRPDDKEETVKKRLEVYHTQTEALVGFYQSLVAKGDSKTKYIKIDGVGDVNEVSRRIFDALDR